MTASTEKYINNIPIKMTKTLKTIGFSSVSLDCHMVIRNNMLLLLNTPPITRIIPIIKNKTDISLSIFPKKFFNN